MNLRALGSTGLHVGSVVLGGNVFGWTLDETESFKVLDAFVDHGFNAIDTADVYTAWVPGNLGGESETIIGNWLRARPGIKDEVVVFTKVGCGTDGQPRPGGLSFASIHKAIDASLARLGLESIDVYFSHFPDAATPISETLAAYDDLLSAGKIRAIGASNMDAQQISDALKIAETEGLPAYRVVQPEYNLYNRDKYEGALQTLCMSRNIGVVNYYGLAAGFLTGKYRSPADLVQSPRGARMSRYMNARGESILASLDAVASEHGATPGEVALAWLMVRGGITAPIASATRVAHIESFARAANLSLTVEELLVLDQAAVSA